MSISYRIELLPEEIPFEGNASAIDDETDGDNAEWIRSQLRAGNNWAWCCVRVVASFEFEGETFEGFDMLGGCSYLSEADFKQPGGYYLQMCADARQALQHALETRVTVGREAARALKALGVS